MKDENIFRHDIKEFRDRIESLRGDTSQEDFCKGIGINVRTYQNWINPLYKNYNGTKSYTLPNIETAIKICDKYEVSLDYLFGRIDCETVTNQNICNQTGLSDQAIETLKAINKTDKAVEKIYENQIPMMSAFSAFLSFSVLDDISFGFIKGIQDYINADNTCRVFKNMDKPEIAKALRKELGLEERDTKFYQSVALQRISESVTKTLNRITSKLDENEPKRG